MHRLTEYIVELLSKTKLFEMALARADYLFTVRLVAGQIVENWCLVRYCTLFDPDNINKNNWKTELEAPCYKLFQVVTKHNKKRLLETGLIKELELNNESVLTKYIIRKFKKERIADELRMSVVKHDFAEALPHIIYLLSEDDYNELYRYIDEDI